MGSDMQELPYQLALRCFNPRSRMGSDDGCQSCVAVGPGFQSTLPYGERRIFWRRMICSSWFQSTLPYGERLICHFAVYPDKGFNPRSRMGSDPGGTVIGQLGQGFQSTLPYGERPQSWTKLCRRKCFNPRSRMGSDSNHVQFFTIFRDCLCNYNNIIVLIQAY